MGKGSAPTGRVGVGWDGARGAAGARVEPHPTAHAASSSSLHLWMDGDLPPLSLKLNLQLCVLVRTAPDCSHVLAGAGPGAVRGSWSR